MNNDCKKKMVTAAIDAPLSAKAEAFIKGLCHTMQPDSDRPARTLEDFATTLRGHFKLTIPIVPQLTKFLNDLGIEMISSERQSNVNVDGSFEYAPSLRQWQIHIANDLGNFESRTILHEVFEIFFWRCYHQIPWFKQWAIDQDIFDPHDQADEFAFFMMLPRKKFCNIAKKQEYDIWELASKCSVHSSMCFNAISRYVHFRYPFCHMRFSFAAKEVNPSFVFDDTLQRAMLAKKAYKAAKNEEFGLDWRHVDPQILTNWILMERLDPFRPQGDFMEMPPADICAQAFNRQEIIVVDTDEVAGFKLAGITHIIARPGPNSQVYIQIVPFGHGQYLKAKPIDAFTAWPKLPRIRRATAI